MQYFCNLTSEAETPGSACVAAALLSSTVTASVSRFKEQALACFLTTSLTRVLSRHVKVEGRCPVLPLAAEGMLFLSVFFLSCFYLHFPPSYHSVCLQRLFPSEHSGSPGY